MKKYTEKTKAQILRANQTKAERLLWQKLRNRQLSDQKFRRQHSIGNYIVDFCCIRQKLIIELDGGHHNETEQINYDHKRTKLLNSEGFTVLRFWNNQVLNETEQVLNAILIALQKHPHPDPLPRGEGE